ncbi:transcriptional regulator [Salmonella enterica subsp. enterica serovar Hartford]|nr:transcriptional regulator [Salmonella enterica subsp. enterica serovar Hartford]
MEPLRDTRNRLLNGWQLSKLYTFEVAARHQSFALAADELSLSPQCGKPSYQSTGSRVGNPAICPLSP